MQASEIIDALISRDEDITRRFFFEDCRPLFISIIRNVFNYEVDYDEFVNEFYIYLMERDAYRLRQFEGRSSIYQWMKVVAIRYFIHKRDKMIDNASKEPLSEHYDNIAAVSNEHALSGIDIDALLLDMHNRRYAYVIRRIVLDEAEPKTVAEELCVTVDNLYNIKKRAIASLTDTALKDIEKYGKR
ncbi:MAG: sigma-70 family RNA polymerase sigma factor [Bacteroidales bacterium]|nr:sigma-70 family RNA polymerase sigma factor [Bacteroides sp.]MCM1199351.1 hypothetical protein [Clostridium sp.]MCM1503083.1 sigma-70 family RNA polymerase sigma factor [Bacteroidales bacterium]